MAAAEAPVVPLSLLWSQLHAPPHAQAACVDREGWALGLEVFHCPAAKHCRLFSESNLLCFGRFYLECMCSKRWTGRQGEYLAGMLACWQQWLSLDLLVAG